MTMEMSQFEVGDKCPKCGAEARKVYNFGNPHVPDSEVCTFRCTHAVALRHDPVGQYPAEVRFHDDVGAAMGEARFHKMRMSAKYS